MSPTNFWFAFCALVTLGGALTVLAAHSPLRAVLGLLGAILGIAGLYLKLGAELLAAVQLLVYAGAVVVLFVFVIMLIGPEAGPSVGGGRSRLVRTTGGALALLGVGLALVMLHTQTSEPIVLGATPPGHGTVAMLGGALFGRGLVVFELSTALLTVAVVGAIAIARSRTTSAPQPPEAHPTRRLFGGPVHPRDAGHPLPKDDAS